MKIPVRKTAFRWFRRTHDVIAVMLCCLWVAGWFGTLVLRTEATSFSANAFVVHYTHDVDHQTQSDLDAPRFHFVETDWTDKELRLELYYYHVKLYRSGILSETNIKWEQPEGQNRYYIERIRVSPSLFIIFPFLFWPLGRLTHRIARRPEKIPNPA